MKRSPLSKFAIASLGLFFLSVVGCGDASNEVIQPAALTPEQQAEMDKLGDDIKATQDGGGKGLSKSGN